MILDRNDPDAHIDRLAADGAISADDAQTLHDFAAFVADPASRCPVCLGADHTNALACPEVSDADKAAARARRR